MPELHDPLTSMRGVGPALAEKLGRLGAARIEDLLFQLPLRYEDRTTVTPLGSVRAGQRYVVHGEVLLAETLFRGRRRRDRRWCIPNTGSAGTRRRRQRRSA